ncbi:hypothetical protein [Acinetobacter sp.]|uniref:hypothetical protein n=1 Tax=Acinetobacter sp. TaxID=472 RepID=UPI0033423D5D
MKEIINGNELFIINSKIIDKIEKEMKENGVSCEKTMKYLNNFNNDNYVENDEFFLSEEQNPKIKEILKKNIHVKLLQIRNKLYLNRSEIIRNWVDGFDDGGEDIIYKLQTEFNGAFSEIYLYKVLKMLNFTVDFTEKRPDFYINKNDIKYIIEVGGSNFAQKDVNKKITDYDRNLKNDNFSLKKPLWKENEKILLSILNESIKRYNIVLKRKHKSYKDGYSKLDHVKNTDFYLLSLISFSQINYGRENHYGALALFYGKYLQSDRESYIYKDKNRINGIKLNVFNQKNNGKYKYDYLSAVIFTSKLTLGKVASLAEGSIKKNPNYIFQIYENLEDKKSEIVSLTNVIPEQFFDKALVRTRHERNKENTDYKPENFSKLEKHLKSKKYTDNSHHLMDGLFILHNPNAKHKIDMEVFDHPNIVQIYQEKNGELKFYKNSKTLVSLFDHPWMDYPNNDPLEFEKEVKRNFNID